MAGAADKARFFLEQSIPDLQELERKNIFSKEEVASITKRRSDFEHKVNARGAKPSDFIRYTDFELNLEALRSRKAKRLGVKRSKPTGQKRALSILDRATKKFHGDLKLWMLYLDVAKRQKAFSKVAEIFTNLVRLHPAKPDVWILAANYAIEEHGDMTEARSYMQRGLRFCKTSEKLWLSYARLELIVISKIVARQQILGLRDLKGSQEKPEIIDDPNADTIALPAVTQNDINPELKDGDVNEDALRALEATPALSGAIPIAVFDTAANQFQSAEFARHFFNLVSDFGSIPCCARIVQHILEWLNSTAPNDAVTLDCWIREPLTGVSERTAAFPEALGSAFVRLKSSLDDHPSPELVQKTVFWILSYFKHDLDQSVKAALQALLLRTLTKYTSIADKSTDPSGNFSASMLESASGDAAEAIREVLPWALEVWPANERLRALSSSSHASDWRIPD